MFLHSTKNIENYILNENKKSMILNETPHINWNVFKNFGGFSTQDYTKLYNAYKEVEELYDVKESDLKTTGAAKTYVHKLHRFNMVLCDLISVMNIPMCLAIIGIPFYLLSRHNKLQQETYQGEYLKYDCKRMIKFLEQKKSKASAEDKKKLDESINKLKRLINEYDSNVDPDANGRKIYNLHKNIVSHGIKKFEDRNGS